MPKDSAYARMSNEVLEKAKAAYVAQYLDPGADVDSCNTARFTAELMVTSGHYQQYSMVPSCTGGSSVMQLGQQI